MKYRFYLNEDVYFDIFLNDDGTYKVEDYGSGFADTVRVSYENGRLEVSALGKKIGHFSLESDHVFYYANHYTTALEIRSYNEARVRQKKGEDISDQIENVSRLRNGGIGISYHSQTEMHTHFIEMLSGEDFLKILFSMFSEVPDIPVGSDGHLIGHLGLDESGNRLPVEHYVTGFVPLGSNQALYLARELEVPMTKQHPFTELSAANSRRNNLIDYVAKQLKKTKYSDKSVGDIKAIIFSKLLVASLELLKAQGIKYTEISYSNDSTIKKMLALLDPEALELIDFSILLSANRQRFKNVAYVNETKKNLRNLLKRGLVRGFDLMGEEKPFDGNDFNYNDPTSIASFIDYVLPLLNGYEDSVLRLHMGENQDSYTNPLDSLRIIAEVVEKHSLTIPPPYIRLGHAIHFDYSKSTEYLKLLKDLGVVIEINASSNYAISNIRNLLQIPYAFYRKNGIPVVLASDGAGAHRTTVRQEDFIGETMDPELPVFLQASEQYPGVIKK